MVQINFAQKQINAKVVYYGPGMSGKTTNLEVIHQRAPAPNRGDLTSISTDGDRTLFFDYMPLDLGTVAGMRTCFQIYTVPGQVYYNSTRKLVLQGVDGVIFVADSSEKMREQNLESLKNLEENLAEYGKSIATMPLVIQYNKRDLPDSMSLEKLEEDMNTLGVPSFEAVANTGQGVFPTLKALAAVVLKNLSQEAVGGGGAAPAPPAAPPAAAAPMPAPSVPQATPAQHAAPPPPQAAPVQPTAAPQPAMAAQPPHDPSAGPVSIPLTDTGMTPRANVGLPPGAPAQPMAEPQAPFAGVPQAGQAPMMQPQPAQLATAAPPQPVARPKPTAAHPGAKPAAQPRTRRIPAAAQQEGAGKRGNLVYTGAFIVLATAVGAVLARAILSVL